MMRHPFTHEAMATTFTIVIADQLRDYARQATTAAFRELDRLENEFSLYVESSDIARANRMKCGETISIGDDALQCLLLAAEVSLVTGRAFDAAYASDYGPDVPLVYARSRRPYFNFARAASPAGFGGDWQRLRARPA